MRIEPDPANACFGCGGANVHGMHLTFEQDDTAQRIRALLRLGPQYQGGAGIIHGGIIALVLDEAMGKVARFRGVHAVTAELKIEYRAPVRVNEDLVVEAYELQKVGRNLHFTGEIRNSDGMVLARGTGRFVVINASRVADEPPAETQESRIS